MEFCPTTISSIKSISQRTIALAWSRAAAAQAFPTPEAFNLPERGHDPKFLILWRVVGTGIERDFHATYQGSHIRTAFHADWVGRSMKDLIPEPLRAAALDAADFCVDNARGIYMVYQTKDDAGRRVDCERMLLPLGSPEGGVRQIVASMEVISMEGDVVLSTALSRFTSEFQIAVARHFGPDE